MAQHKVVVYSTKTCVYCRLAKEYFKQKAVKFTEYDVGEDQTRAEEMVEKSGQMGVPVIDINGQVIIGFNKPAIEKALA